MAACTQVDKEDEKKEKARGGGMRANGLAVEMDKVTKMTARVVTKLVTRGAEGSAHCPGLAEPWLSL